MNKEIVSKEKKVEETSNPLALEESRSGVPSIELRHESMEEIMGAPPSVMVRIGSGLLLAIIVILVSGSVFFPSDVKIQLPAILDGGLPLSMIIAPATGNMKHYPHEGLVNRGDTLLFIENTNEELVPVFADFSGFFEVNPLIEMKRHIHENDTVGFIWPADQDTVVCKIRLTAAQGKEVRVGNKVRIAIDDYPVEQYGVFETTIHSISHFNATFHAFAELPVNMITTTQQHLDIRGYNQATVVIITKEKTVFYRLINPFKGLIKM